VLTPPTGKVDGLISNLFKPENSRRNLPDTNEETVNEYLHISALQRWRLPQVQHDLAEDKDSPLQSYRPPNPAALISERKGKKLDVAGGHGEVMAANEIPGADRGERLTQSHQGRVHLKARPHGA